MATKTKKTPHSKVKLGGFFRLQILENGKVVGDSGVGADGKLINGDGFRENQVTNLGIEQYLVNALCNASPKNVTHMALGTGGAPAASDTSLSGEITHATNSRKTVSTSAVSSKTAQFTAAFNSADSFVTASVNISNIGLFNTSTTAAGTMFAGNTYTSSSLATNQNVQATYQIRFS